MQVVQGLSKAAEKGAAKAEMKSKEATSRGGWGRFWSDAGFLQCFGGNGCFSMV
jgi:hypothetical protein